jgi:hypothetical protein
MPMLGNWGFKVNLTIWVKNCVQCPYVRTVDGAWHCRVSPVREIGEPPTGGIHRRCRLLISGVRVVVDKRGLEV